MARFEPTPESVQIVVLPIFRERDQWIDFVSRAAWYLGKSSFKEIVVFVADASLANQPWEIGSEFSEDLQDVVAVLALRIRLIVQPTDSQIRDEVRRSRILLQLEEPLAGMEFSEDELLGKRVVVADRLKTRQEGGAWNQVNYVLRRDFAHEVIACRDRFTSLVLRLGKFQRAYVIASGPSISDYPKFEYENALVVVCNSVIFDEDLMEQVRPQILVFADPIFHFGPSQYAGTFRRKLRAAASRHDFTILIPEKYFGLFTDWFPELRGRTIAVPLGDVEGEPNLNLLRHFNVLPTPNVLTMLMLPVASTFARDIWIIGCDGRPVEQNSYFWSHHPKAQIGDKMQNIRNVHPAFFAIDYDDYYSEHCAFLEQLLCLGESLGHRYFSATFSHIPALASRSTLLPRVLVLDPSPIHGRSATGQLKSDLFANWQPGSYLQIGPRASTDGTRFRIWDLDSAYRIPPEGITSRQAMAEAVKFNPEVIYIRPTDEPVDFLNFVKLAISEINAPFVFHIMDDWPERAAASHPDRGTEIDQSTRELLSTAADCLSIGPEMSTAFKARYGVEFTAVSNGVSAADWSDPAGTEPDQSNLVIRYCGALAADMTLASIDRVVREVSTLSAEHPIRIELYVLQTFLEDAVARFDSLPGVSVLPSVEDRSAYRALLQSAGALVIGYNFDPSSIQYTRYSVANKLPECLASGRPLLVHGPSECATVSRARSLGVSLVVDQDNPVAVRAALLSLIQHRADHEMRARELKTKALLDFSLDTSRTTFEQVLQSAAAHRRQGITQPRKDVLTTSRERRDEIRISEVKILSGMFPPSQATRTLLKVGTINEVRRKQVPRDWDFIEIPPVLLSDSGKLPNEVSEMLMKADFLAFECHEETERLFKVIDWVNCRAAVVLTTCDNDRTLPMGYLSRNLAKQLVGSGYLNFVSEWHPPFKPDGPKTSWHRLLIRPLETSEKNLLGLGISVHRTLIEASIFGGPWKEKLAGIMATEFESASWTPSNPTKKNKLQQPKSGGPLLLPQRCR